MSSLGGPTLKKQKQDRKEGTDVRTNILVSSVRQRYRSPWLDNSISHTLFLRKKFGHICAQSLKSPKKKN